MRVKHFLNKAESFYHRKSDNTVRVQINKTDEGREIFYNVQKVDVRFVKTSPVHWEAETAGKEILEIVFFNGLDWFSFYRLVNVVNE